MRYPDLNLHELLELDASGGVIGYAGQRVLIWDAVALGNFRRELIFELGSAVARPLFIRLGFAHGYRIAENFRTAIQWNDERDWRIAGARLAQLNGLMSVEPLERVPGSDVTPFAASYWRESWEAQQHLIHFGRSEEAACWTLCGLASGYMSYANQRSVFCVEEQCVACGDKKCLMVANTREGWGARFDELAVDFGPAAVSQALVVASAKFRPTERAFAFGSTSSSVESERAASGMIAHSQAMAQVLRLARRVARVDSSVLIVGESGVGKEGVARLVHTSSPRASGPFVIIDCGAIAPSLLESEIFGHVRGAFTGAASDRVGLLEAAEGGTVFFDEVGELPLPLQAKLLRALQEREIRRVGDNTTRRVNVRVVAATNRDLEAAVVDGSFREDLYYRLRVVEIDIAPLRLRREDILPLARAFLSEGAKKLGEGPARFTSEVVDRLTRHDWPGNARELRNAVEHALAVRSTERIELVDLPPALRDGRPSAVTTAGPVLADVERAHILATLEAHDGNRQRTAQTLGIGIATLYRKLRSYGVTGTSS